MYHINRKEAKPDIGYLEYTIEKLMNKGIRLANCRKLMTYYSDLRSVLKSEIQQKYGIDNPNSSKQIAEFLEDISSRVDLSSKNDIIENCYIAETQKWTSNADALEKLSDLGYEFAKDLLDYRYAKKFAESIESIAKAVDQDGLVHPHVSLSKTNRIQYSSPALLTIPKKLLWHMIVPYTEGNVLYSVDIKNQEPSILINMTNVVELKDALTNEDGLYETMFKQCYAPTATVNILVDTLPENRVYLINELQSIGTISPAFYSPVKPLSRNVYYNDEKVVAIETICAGSEKGVHVALPETVDIETELGNIYSVPVTWESDEKKYKKSNDYTLVGKLSGLDVRISKAERKEFKTAWNAISYGASIYGVKMSCKLIDGTQAYNFITKNEQLKEYRSNITKLAKSGTNRIGTIFGTQLYSGETRDWKQLKRVLLDLPIQGSAADILSLLVKHFYEYTEQHNLTDKLELYYTRHDELIIEANGDWVNTVGNDEVVRVLRDMLEHQIDDWTPFKVDVKVAKPEDLEVSFEDED